jgi:peptidoglycan/xylan/chitin deacetylase (PgdA/CDA1 family)
MKRGTTHGYFVVSLDFELFWGMFDRTTIQKYGANVRGERTAIPRMLDLFREYGIHATWATVGMLMARNREELLSLLPKEDDRPRYADTNISTYTYITRTPLGKNESDDPYHFGASLVQLILDTPDQEFGNHTFSHFYCIDGHKNPPKIFEKDLELHARIAQSYGITTHSIVFPRNQTSIGALRLCKRTGITAYRGNEDHFLYRARKDAEQTAPHIRLIRLLDHYINMSGHNTYPLPQECDATLPLNIPASRFLRPWSRALRFFEPLRMRRIKNAMTNAAKNGEVFHLWWHPHNFGINQDENFRNLVSILDHYKMLQKKYGMRSMSMKEVTECASKS